MSADVETKNGSKNGKKTSAGALTIRLLDLDDLPAVFALGEKLFSAEKWPTLYRTWDKYELVELYDADGETCLVAEEDGRIVGFALGTLIEKRHSAWKYGYLLWLGVDPEHGRQGVGRRLISRLTEILVGLGARMILVDTDPENEEALSFFRKEGFRNEQPHVYLSRNLTHDPVYLRHRSRRNPGRSHAAPASGATAPGRGGDGDEE